MPDTKYPAKIEKLFAPKLPLTQAQPVDYPIERRHTAVVTPVSNWKAQYTAYVKELQSHQNEPKQESQASARRRAKAESTARQLREWQPPVLEKSPYNTVFVSRLDYAATELDLSHQFKTYGAIESIKIVRDNSGKSRGYAFVVFERDVDASNCVQELARTGVKITSSASGKSRIALVDIERARVVRGWKPTRLGGGLGGRHYTKPDGRANPMASAAASARRMNLPRQQPRYGYTQHVQPKPVKAQSVRDKYAKYNY